VIQQGDVWWADLSDPVGSTPGYRLPVVVVQGNQLNASRLNTIICIPLTGNVRWAEVPTSLLLKAASTGLDRDSVALTTQIISPDRSQFLEWVGRISERQLKALLAKLDVALGR
jgi:mRNA interferase MazF